MSRPSRQPHVRSWFAWLALAAVLAVALAPAVSHAIAFARGASSWVEVCTPQGMKLVAVDAAQASEGDGVPMQTAGHLEHCPFCSLQGLDSAPPPAPAAVPALLLAAAEVPRLFLQAPRTLFAWRSAQPRGPPAIS